MSFTAFREKDSSAIYIAALFLFAILLCSYNIFNGFGEDADSTRMIESAIKSHQLHVLIPSRSWGYPLYEVFVYPLINSFSPSLLPAKLFSLLLLLGTVYILFKTLLKLNLSKGFSFLLCLVFLSNPLEIISGNSILETSMSIFFMTLIIYYFINTTPGRKLTLSNYVWYGILFGLATLARPDNLLYFPAIFLFLLFRKEFNIGYIFISGIIFLALGILPYYLIHYPIFHSPAAGISNNPLAVLKNFVATFGLPLFILVLAGIVCMYSGLRPALKKVFTWKNEIFRFLLIIVALVIVRVLKLSDELEYGLLIWPVSIIWLGMIVKEMSLLPASDSPENKPVYSKAFISRALICIAIATLLPNIIQLYFFKTVDFDYKFSVGLTSGVLKQEKERRILYEEILNGSGKILSNASDSLRNKNLNYAQHVHYDDCDTCIVLTTVRDFRLYKRTINATGTDLSRNRIVYTIDFNISRGWRNFIRDSYIPPFTESRLKLQN